MPIGGAGSRPGESAPHLEATEGLPFCQTADQRQLPSSTLEVCAGVWLGWDGPVMWVWILNGVENTDRSVLPRMPGGPPEEWRASFSFCI